MSAPLRFATTPADVSRFAGVFEHVFETVTAGVTLQSPQVGLSFLPVYRLPICLLQRQHWPRQVEARTHTRGEFRNENTLSRERSSTR